MAQTQTPRTGSGEQGVVFPLVDGARSSTATGRAVFADAARAVDAELGGQIEAERDWRTRYLVHVRKLLEASLVRREDALAVASAGLASLHARFEFLRDGDAVPLAQALRATAPAPLHTVTLSGATRHERPDELRVPYKGEHLRGDALRRQLERWMQAGTVEPSFVEAVGLVMDNPDWLDLSDRQVAVLGAGAEMGPLGALCRWGATVLPVDLDRVDVWSRVLAAVRAGRGRAHIPVRRPVGPDEDDAQLATLAGANLVTDVPAVSAWLDRFDGPLVVGNYVYADGAMNVRVAMAVDLLAAHLTATRQDVSLAMLATPTDVFAVPQDAVHMAQSRFAQRRPRLLIDAARLATRERFFAPNYERLSVTAEGLRFGVADALVPQQGPNYALAKRLQRWRAVVARDQGLVVSMNVAPATRTRSVLKNRVLAAAYAGAPRFGVEIFDPATSNTLMAALLVHDLRNPRAPANPDTPLQHPLELFLQGANHGGLWRIAYAPRSVLGLAAAVGMVQRR